MRVGQSILNEDVGMSNSLKGLLLKFLLVAALATLGAAASHAQVSIGIEIGAPPPPRVVVAPPPAPEPGYMWIEGYWYPVGKHYKWHAGYWTLPPYPGAHWVAPRHDGQRYFEGYWDGDRGHVEHDHRWDHDHDRDHDRWHDRDDHHDDHDRDHHDHDDHDHH